MRYFDMLVKLYELPEIHTSAPALKQEGIRILRPMASNKGMLSSFIRTHFSDVWANEFEKAICNTPVSCFIAVNSRKEPIGFSCFDASYRNFFGLIGVLDEYRGKKICRELLLYALTAMRESGYAYATIGWSSDKNAPFYSRVSNAMEIPDSFPGIYKTRSVRRLDFFI